MAKLITTQAEKDAASYLDWDDVALGRMCKKMALTLQGIRKKKRDKAKGDGDISAVINASEGILLISNMIDCNAATLTLKLGDFTHNGDPAGDWEIKVRQTKSTTPQPR